MTRTTKVNFGVVSELTLANETVNLILEKTQDRNVTVYRGGMIAGQRLLVVELLKQLIPKLDAPDSIQNLAITKMAVELRPDKGAFAFEAAIENAWSITLASGPTLSIDRLALSVLSVKPPTTQGNNGSRLDSQEKKAEEAEEEAAALSQQRKLKFEGLFQLFGGTFTLSVIHQFSSKSLDGGNAVVASQWGFSALADNISITEIIKAFGFSDVDSDVDKYGLRDLTVNLAFTLNQTRYKQGSTQIEESSYTFQGKVDWVTNISLTPEEDKLQIEAAVEIAKTSSTARGAKSSALRGAIAGTVKASIPFFDTLQLSVIYTFTQTRVAPGAGRRSSKALAKRTGKLIFHLQISTLLLSAVYTDVSNRKLLRFSVSLVIGNNPTIGDLIAYIVSLYDPSITDFELDPPWDEFSSQPIDLSQFSLEVDLTQKSVSMSYKKTVNVLIAKVSNLALSYQFGADPAKAKRQRKQARTASNKQVAIAVNLSIPGQPQKRVQWDPVNENPPAVPGRKAPIFDLKFLALGQRVAFAPEIVQQARTIEQVTNVMRQTLVPLPPIKRRQNPLTALQQALPSAVSSDPSQPINFSGQPIVFSAESGWLIGAQFSILGAFDLSVIFNDPFIYGLRLSLSGPLVQSFAGLEFEILYRRISDTVGVYRTELTLPDAMRQLEFGAVSITLPVVAIEIYTNGDFGIDVGFPWGGDFSRSIAVSVLIFLGVGGFYFNKLSAETATSVPAITNGTFDPVLEFGIGLRVGLGKILQKGPLRAEISITMHGLLQGVFATFNPTDTNQSKVTYYRVQGGVAIVGRIYGVVDFKVIQVDIEVLIKVAVLFVLEVYKAIQIALVATISVKASAKVAFIRVKFKFKLTVRQQFVLGSDSRTPWQLPLKETSVPPAPLPADSRFLSLDPPQALSSPPQAFPSALQPLQALSFPPQAFQSAASNMTAFTTTNRFTRTRFKNRTSASVIQTPGVSSGSQRSLRWKALKLAKPRSVRPKTWYEYKDDNGKDQSKLRLDIYFQPSLTRTDKGVSGVSLLFIENSIPVDEQSESDKDTDFDELVKALFKWVIYAALTDDERTRLTSNSTGIDVSDYKLGLEILEDIDASFKDYLEKTPAQDHYFWTPLIGFLQANFIFDVTDRPTNDSANNDGISGTIFPMFPQLTMKTMKTVKTVKQTANGGNEETVTKEPIKSQLFDTPKYESVQIVEIRQYFKRLNKNHNPITDETAEGPNRPTRKFAIAEILFIDYFTLIIRSALQQGIDYIRYSNGNSNQTGIDQDGKISVVTLLDKLGGRGDNNSVAGGNANGSDGYALQNFQDLAGMTSRFLLHGLRLPTFKDNTSTINGYSPIYIETGQQFEITVKKTDQSGQSGQSSQQTTTIEPDEIRLGLTHKIDFSWIRLIDHDPVSNTPLTPQFFLNFPFLNSKPVLTGVPNKTIDIVTRVDIEAMKEVNLADMPRPLPNISSNFKWLDKFYDDNVFQRYAIRQQSSWQSGGSKTLLLDLPKDLCNYLQHLKKKQESASFTLKYTENSEGKVGRDLQEQSIPGTDYAWATKIKLKIRRVVNSTSLNSLPTIYKIEGLDESSKTLIDQLLEAKVTLETINLLYLNSSGETGNLVSDQSPTVSLLKTNLSLEKKNPTTARLTEHEAFLRLLLEGNAVNGEGYFLYYQKASDAKDGLPDKIFTEGATSTLSLLIQFKSVTNPASYHNCITIKQPNDLIGRIERDEIAIFVESNKPINVLQIPAGNLGFKVERDEALENPSSAKQILQGLYQLLSYEIPKELEADFVRYEDLKNNSVPQERLPIGPQESAKGNKWVYEKVLPVSALTKEAANESAALPKELRKAINPYYGIRNSLVFKLGFQWQDVYGNRLEANSESIASKKLGYFDPILGVNQWPSVGESYTITAPKEKTVLNQADLTLELVFDQAKYVPTPTNLLEEARERIKADRATYQQIYYQVHDPNLKFTVSTSVIPNWSQDLQTRTERTVFTSFVDSVYKYLVTLEHLTEEQHEIPAGETPILESVQKLYRVDLRDLADINSDVSGIFDSTSAQTIQIPVGISVKASDSLETLANNLIKDPTNQPEQTGKIRQIVKTYRKTANLLATRINIPYTYTDSLSSSVTSNYTVQPGDTFESIAIAQLALKADQQIEDQLESIAQTDATATVLTDGVLIKGSHEAHANNYVTLNATLEEIAYGVLQIENADLNQEFESVLTERINAIVGANESVKLGVGVDILGEQTQTNDTFKILRDRLLEKPNYKDKVSANDLMKIIAQAVRDLLIFPNGAALTINVTEKDKVPPTSMDVTIQVMTTKTWTAIAAGFPNVESATTETAKTIILANAERQDLLEKDAIIAPLNNYTVQAQESLRHIAINQVVEQSSGAPDMLRLDIDIVAEVGALNYSIVKPSPSRNTLAYLAQQLHLQTNRHRTVLETVQAIGNISDLITETKIEAQLAEVASALRTRTSLFRFGGDGTNGQDTSGVLYDVLLEYTVKGEDSFDQMIAAASEHVPQIQQEKKIVIDQTTAADIAVQNPRLKLAASKKLCIPDRFSFSEAALSEIRSALLKQSEPNDSLADLARKMGDGVAPAAVAIANQSLTGLLNPNRQIDDKLSVLAALTKISYISNSPVDSDLERLTAFIDRQSIQTGDQETLYSLKSQFEQEVVKFQNQIEAEVDRAQQSIGKIGAIYEQLTFEGANLKALHESLKTALTQLKTTLLVDVSGNTLKPQFQPSTAYKDPSGASISVDIGPALAKIQAAINVLKTIDALAAPQKTQALSTVQTHLQDALYARKDDPSTYTAGPLDGVHRIYELSCLKTAVDLLEKRSQRPITMSEVGTAIANIKNLVKANTDWIIPPIQANTTLPINIGDFSNLLYPTDLMFSVTTQVTMQRPKNLVHENLKDKSDNNKVIVPEVEAISAYFSPKTVNFTSSPAERAEFSDRLASLDPFATAFEQALPGLKLAVGRNAANIDNANPQNSDTLWAVHLGQTGVSYNINEAFPFFFSAAPLSNTLMSGTVSLYGYAKASGLNKKLKEKIRADAVDLNGLARTYLRAIEDILKPEIAVPAANDTTDIDVIVNGVNQTTTLKKEIERILTVKASLADAISQNVTHVLDTSLDTSSLEYINRQQLAVAALRKELLKNLADAYDIETIVQYNVDVVISGSYTWPTSPAPRLSGQPIMTGAYYTDPQRTPNSGSSDADKKTLLQSLDFALSPAKIALDAKTNNGKSTLTFFFNTQTPQRYEDIAVNLMYQVNELEYNIDTQNSTSSWLNFVVPLNQPGSRTDPNDPNHIGDVQIPIPLRDYPLSPSLIAHKAVPDPDSFSGAILSAEDIRDWNYVFLYEHPDVAQDTIECRIDYNSTLPEQLSKLTIDDVTVSESAGKAVFTVTLFPPSEKDVTVDYATQDETAIAGQDYESKRGKLTFVAGDVAQTISVTIVSDAIVEDNEAFKVILSNATNAEIADAEGVGAIIDAPLLDTLVRFNHLYPTLASELKPLETGITAANRTAVAFALNAFVTLAEEVAQGWRNWQPIAIAQASRQTIQYNIDEDLSVDGKTKTVTIVPTANLSAADKQVLEIGLPGYQLNVMRQDGEITTSPTASYRTLKFDFKKLKDATGVETFGESALPDRKITVANLDILDYQNAWGAIRLARNKNLIDGMATNPAFIFQTPEVRFKDRITPLIINDKRWNIGALSTPSSQTLNNHLKTLFETLLPSAINRPYDIRIACEYAFALVLGGPSADDDLLASLPVLLTPRVTVEKTASASTMLAATGQLRANIVTEMQRWYSTKKPLKASGRYVFSVSLFSNAATTSITDNPNLPLLTVEHLFLKLEDISDAA